MARRERILERITSPHDLGGLSLRQMKALAEEVRDVIRSTVAVRGGHLSSNLGVVEMTIALHATYDLAKDALVWDVSHQTYTHKLLTGRADRFHTLRSRGGLSGFANHNESDYDLFTAGHGGTAISTALGLLRGDRLVGRKRHVVAVVGDGALSEGMSFEALNHAGEVGTGLLVILNDNRMSISATVGALARYLSRIRIARAYHTIKRTVRDFLERIPVVGRGFQWFLEKLKNALRHSLVRGQMFEELGFRYFGPIDGHDLKHLLPALAEAKRLQEESPVLLHVLTRKGRGFRPAAKDPQRFHSARPFSVRNGKVVPPASGGSPTYTDVFGKAVAELCVRDSKVCAITAAMPEGTGLVRTAEVRPRQFFDVGMCEQHALGFAAGLAKAGAKPIVAVYSTFLQRGYDQLFHELALQKLPVVVAIDRAGLVGGDGPTHHGLADVASTRVWPGMVVMAPGDAGELEAMLEFALTLPKASAIRYPRARADFGLAGSDPVRIGRAVELREGADASIWAYGATLATALEAASVLEGRGISAAVTNARFAKPLDAQLLSEHLEHYNVVVTIEEHGLAGGFGSAALEAASARGAPTGKMHLVGVPDEFVPHGKREDLLRELRLDGVGLARRIEALLASFVPGHAAR